jgi:hypothetical protein
MSGCSSHRDILTNLKPAKLAGFFLCQNGLARTVLAVMVYRFWLAVCWSLWAKVDDGEIGRCVLSLAERRGF